MSLSASIHLDESTSSTSQTVDEQIQKFNSNSSDNVVIIHKRSLSSLVPEASIHSNYSSFEHHQQKAFDTNDQDIRLIKQINPTDEIDRNAKKILQDQHSSLQPIKDEQAKEVKMMVDDTNLTKKFVEQNPIVSHIHVNTPSACSSETSEVIVRTTSVSLRDLLSYQDVMNAIEREFHLHAGQEREIIMKLWLKGQAMLSILHRFRHLLQDLNIDDKDFVEGLKQIREIINYADRDVHYLREQTTMLENENRFLETEFQRQLDKIVQEKNEQISRLIHIIDQSCTSTTEYKDPMYDEKHLSGTEELLKQFKQQNVELQREIETLRAKLEYTFTFVNNKLDQQKAETNTSSTCVIQTAFGQIQQTEKNLQELKLKSASQQEENDLLKYILEKTQGTSDIDQTQLLGTIEQRSLQREIDRVRHELEITEKKAAQLEQRFEASDATVQFHIEKLKLKCDVLRKHIITCTQRLDEFNRQTHKELNTEKPTQKIKDEQDESKNQRKIAQLENELLILRERYDEIIEHSQTQKSGLNSVRKQLHEKEKLESSFNADLEQERRRAIQLETELISLKTKHEDACERINVGAHQLQSLQKAFEQTSNRCEQLEDEKSKMDAESKSLLKNVANVTAKYKNKLNTIKSRLEQIEREKRETQNNSEQFKHEIERLKDELTYKKEMVSEKDKLIQDVQYKNLEILRERQTVEEKVSSDSKRLNELVYKNHLLEDELDRLRRSHMSENITIRRTDTSNLDSSLNDSLKYIEELKSKVDNFEHSFAEEKASKESLQVQIKILEEENMDLRDIMSQMRKRTQDGGKEERDRNSEIQQLIARTELNARQYMSKFNLTSLLSPSALVKIVPLSSSTNISCS